MTTRQQLEFGSITFFGLAAFIGIFLAFYGNSFKTKTYALPSTINIENSIITNPIISPVFTPKEESFSQTSPDGTKKVMMSMVSDKDSNKTYTLTTANSDNSEQAQIHHVTLPADQTIAIPFNSFSPDNKYFFVTHIKNRVNEALVFKTNGEPMTETEKYLKVEETFRTKEIKNPYKETTGWASETLLIVNTTPENGSKQSYWFEVPGKAIIGLSTEFYD